MRFRANLQALGGLGLLLFLLCSHSRHDGALDEDDHFFRFDRGPGGETWAGRGATPRWLTALIKEGHSVDEFAIAKGGKRAAAAPKKSAAKKKGRKPAPKKRSRKIAVAKEASAPAA